MGATAQSAATQGGTPKDTAPFRGRESTRVHVHSDDPNRPSRPQDPVMSKDAVADIVLTIVGSDRPGLVEAVAEAVARAGGNWLESRMAHLAGKFAGILRVQAAGDAIPRLVAAIEHLAHAT